MNTGDRRIKNMIEDYSQRPIENETDRNLVRVSKFLSLVLRHKPETIELSLDESGWARVDELLIKANDAGLSMDKVLLRQVVEGSDKKRFSFSEDGQRIRANYGHSIPIDLSLEAVEPPEFLYHGTTIRFIVSIKMKGIVPQERTHVHLSPDEDSAMEVGQRHGKPIVLIIRAKNMHEDGFKLYYSDSGLWLTEKVPPEYIIFPSE
jgi:putative RNA 2'-phosphotransferase